MSTTAAHDDNRLLKRMGAHTTFCSENPNAVWVFPCSPPTMEQDRILQADWVFPHRPSNVK